jgi:nicotinamide-nucleotide amidase
VVGVDAAEDVAARVAAELLRRGERLALGESCTGGGVAARLAAIPGASRWLWGAAVVYSDDAKVKLLGLPSDDLRRHGAVSEPTTRALARAVRELAGVEWGAAVTCWAGPDGGTGDEPVGTAYLAVAGEERVQCRRAVWAGSRADVCAAAGAGLLELLLALLENPDRPTRGFEP